MQLEVIRRDPPTHHPLAPNLSLRPAFCSSFRSSAQSPAFIRSLLAYPSHPSVDPFIRRSNHACAHLSVCPSLHPFVHPSVHPSTQSPLTRSPLPSSTESSFYPPIYQSVCSQAIHLPIPHPSVHRPSFSTSIHPPIIYPSSHPTHKHGTHLFTVYPSICPAVHPPVPSLIQPSIHEQIMPNENWSQSGRTKPCLELCDSVYLVDEIIESWRAAYVLEKTTQGQTDLGSDPHCSISLAA